MKKIVQFGLCLIAFLAIGTTAKTQNSPVKDSVTMGAGYANEVYYSMANGFIGEFPRNSWDIAFRTRIMSSSILTNEGIGVLLYTYPKSDTSGWSTVDTNGLYTWKPMFNDPKDWENGAFCRNFAGGLDFGWGVYNLTTHNLTGDSIFIIQTPAGFRKIWIVEKISVDNIYEFRYANLDGTDEHDIHLDCNPYKSMDFIGFSLTNNDVVTIQPAASTWDILFTKYIYVFPDGTPYPVTGVLNSDTILTQTFQHVPVDFTGYNPDAWDTTRSGIGWEWKSFDGTQYVIVDSLVYFVKNRINQVNRLVFKKFEGSTTGKIVFEKTKMVGLGIEDRPAEAALSVYPNPAKSRISFSLGNLGEEPAKVTVTDLTGRDVYTGQYASSSGPGSIDLSGLSPGIYFLRVMSGNISAVKKFIVSR